MLRVRNRVCPAEGSDRHPWSWLKALWISRIKESQPLVDGITVEGEVPCGHGSILPSSRHVPLNDSKAVLSLCAQFVLLHDTKEFSESRNLPSDVYLLHR